MNERLGSAPRLCSPRLPTRPPSRIVCPGAGALLPAPKVHLRGRLHSRNRRRIRPTQLGCPLRRPHSPQGLEPRPRLPRSASLGAGAGIARELQLLCGSLLSDGVGEQVLRTRGSGSRGPAPAVNTPGRAHLWGALSAPVPGGAAGGPARVGDLQPEGTCFGTVPRPQLCRVQVQPYFQTKQNFFFFFGKSGLVNFSPFSFFHTKSN